MQNSTTILGIIEMRLKGISYDDCRNRYGVGNSTVNLIMTRYLEKGVPLEVLKQMPAEEVEASFYPPSNVRRKSEDIMPDYEAIYDRLHREGSKANLYFLWLRYKQEHPSGYQYTQFCHYFNRYVSTAMGPRAFVWPWSGFRESGCTSTGSATSRSFWWTLRPANYGRYISSSPPSASAA